MLVLSPIVPGIALMLVLSPIVPGITLMLILSLIVPGIVFMAVLFELLIWWFTVQFLVSISQYSLNVCHCHGCLCGV
jgi:hypothetical protein